MLSSPEAIGCESEEDSRRIQSRASCVAAASPRASAFSRVACTREWSWRARPGPDPRRSGHWGHRGVHRRRRQSRSGEGRASPTPPTGQPPDHPVKLGQRVGAGEVVGAAAKAYYQVTDASGVPLDPATQCRFTPDAGGSAADGASSVSALTGPAGATPGAGPDDEPVVSHVLPPLIAARMCVPHLVFLARSFDNPAATSHEVVVASDSGEESSVRMFT